MTSETPWDTPSDVIERIDPDHKTEVIEVISPFDGIEAERTLDHRPRSIAGAAIYLTMRDKENQISLSRAAEIVDSTEDSVMRAKQKIDRFRDSDQT